MLFTHLLRSDGSILAQRDVLDAPSWSWRAGDVIVQIHQIFLPGDTLPGTYDTVVGIYDRASGVRLPVSEGGDRPGADVAEVTPLTVQ